MTENRSTQDFIRGTLKDEIGAISTHHPYLTFVLIAQGIELLGACLDEQAFTELQASEERFKKAITALFPTQYAAHNKAQSPHYLYEQLRCGLVHTLRPQSTIVLSTRAQNPGKHLTTDANDRLILCLEDFLDDFFKACDRVIAKLDAHKITNPKVYNSFLTIMDDASGSPLQ